MTNCQINNCQINDANSDLCDICMGRLDYIKCKYCSNKICVACITKLETLAYHYKYFTYDCCVCKKNNSLSVKDINDITDLQNIINDLSNKYLDINAELDDDLYISAPVVLYYPPVLTNNDFIYCGTNIILHRTLSNNHFVCLETLGATTHFSYDNVISRHHQQNDYELQPNKDFYYITSLQDINSRLNITLITKTDFQDLIDEKVIQL
jgi:hypothetical protein